MPSAQLQLLEEDVVKLMLEFLQKREMGISQLSIERESGVINGLHSDDLLFLRQLILDGQWNDVIDFVQPLSSIPEFDSNAFKYIILKHKYLELLCIRSETGGLLLQPPTTSQYGEIQMAVDEVVGCLNELEKVCTSKEDYSQLCLLLTLPHLSDHLEFKNWNPSNSRIKCFCEVQPLLAKFLPLDKKVSESQKCAQGDRLVQLLIKGILYESCVLYCQQKATASANKDCEMKFRPLLGMSSLSDSDLSLMSWLESVPPDTFSCPFEQKQLKIDVQKLDKPSLEAAWTEQILSTPIKPKRFPHSAMPYPKSRSVASELMSRSLAPNIEGLLGSNKQLMTMSVGDLAAMSKSFAGFHLSNKKAMNTSVDRLFSDSEVLSSSYACLPSIVETPNISASSVCDGSTKMPDTSTNKSPVFQNDTTLNSTHNDSSMSKDMSQSKSDLWLEFNRQKQILMQQLEEANNKLQKEYSNESDNKIAEEISNRNGGKNSIADDSNHTPTNLQGSANFHHLAEKLTTSTPRNENLHRAMPEPVASPVFGHTPAPHSTYASTPNVYSRLQGNHAVKNLGAVMETITSMNASIGSSPPYPNSYSPHQHYGVATNGNQAQTAIPDYLNNSSPGSSTKSNGGPATVAEGEKPKFVPVTSLEDVQAIRAASFHPFGKVYAIGSNSKTLRICGYPKMTTDLRHDHEAYQPTVLFKRTKHHKGSIYCLAWNATGDLIATGSNDKSVKLTRFNPDNNTIVGQDSELTMHDGTVRDLIFIEDLSNRSNLLISAGAGDCKIYVTDCETATPFQAMSGHSGHVLSLYTWGGAMFVSGSQDRTIRFWDLRTRGCVNVVSPPSASGSGPGSVVASVCVDPSGRLLVSGQEDSACMLYDIRGGRIIQSFKPHQSDVRTVRFSPSALYLLSGSYDHKVVLTDLQGDLTSPLPSVVVAEHSDKVIQSRWHPKEFSFLTTSADKTATLWALPPL